MTTTKILTKTLLGGLNDVESKFAPEYLYYSGDISIIKRYPKISIVGTRKPSLEGRELAQHFVSSLINNDICIVSGLAEGIDTVAHTSALEEAGKTIAVIGTPLDCYYPKENSALQNRLTKEQLVISQFAQGTKTTPACFPLRNRTMALISDATLIIEAGEKSGTEHQAWEALRLGRPLFVTEHLALKHLKWVDKVISYGAQVISEADLAPIFEEIPSFIETDTCSSNQFNLPAF